jgi:hypothetical protein
MTRRRWHRSNLEPAHVRFGSKADIGLALTNVRFMERDTEEESAGRSRRRNGKTVTRRERVTDHILTTEWESAVNFAKYDVERAEYRRNVSEHVSASQEIHCRQVWE